MRAKSSYTISEVVDLSKESESTVRRQIKEGRLELVDGSRPRRVSGASVHEYLRSLIDEGPRFPDGVAGAPATLHQLSDSDAVRDVDAFRRDREYAVRDLEAKLQEVEAENERLRNTIQTLRQTNQILLDDLGQYTSPRIPNN